MKIKITGNENHNVYGTNGMRGKLEYGFKELGHEIVESGEELLIVPGASADLSEIETSGKKIFWSHGVNWSRGFENEDNTVLKNNFDNCDVIAYQSEFAKWMTEKAFGEKDGPMIYNASIPNFPDSAPMWFQGHKIKLVACSIWRAWKRLHEIERLVRGFAAKGFEIELSVIGKDPADDCPFGEPKKGDNYEIKYLGLMNIDQMKDIYHESHVGIHLAFNDYSPASVLEMMAMGLPVIVTDSGGSKDIVGTKGGIVLRTDPFVDESFAIHNEGVLPKVDDDRFEDALYQMIHNMRVWQKSVKEWVEEEANCVKQAEKFLTL